MKTLEQRYSEAIDAIGGTFALLALPDPVKKALALKVDLETKVKMLEAVAAAKSK